MNSTLYAWLLSQTTSVSLSFSLFPSLSFVIMTRFCSPFHLNYTCFVEIYHHLKHNPYTNGLYWWKLKQRFSNIPKYCSCKLLHSSYHLFRSYIQLQRGMWTMFGSYDEKLPIFDTISMLHYCDVLFMLEWAALYIGLCGDGDAVNCQSFQLWVCVTIEFPLSFYFTKVVDRKRRAFASSDMVLIQPKTFFFLLSSSYGWFWNNFKITL